LGSKLGEFKGLHRILQLYHCEERTEVSDEAISKFPGSLPRANAPAMTKYKNYK
jgi:hypothetical protein